MHERIKKGFSLITPSIILILSIAGMFGLFTSGCSREPVEVEVEEVAKTGENLEPLRNKILKDVKYNIQLWIKGDEKKLREAFTENMMNMWREARNLDKKEGVKRVRVHENQKFEPSGLDTKRPQLTYTFLDKSYFVDARTGKPKTKPYNKERTIIMFLVKEGGRYKIDNMVGEPDALR